MPSLKLPARGLGILLALSSSIVSAAVCDLDGDNDVDRDDVIAIMGLRNTPASGPDDPADADGDGTITLLDARSCVLQCTLAGCASPPSNTPPTADAGPDQTRFVGDTVQLDGSASSDVDGDPLTFQWSLISAPTGSSAALSDDTVVNPTLVLDAPGTYIVELTVNDGQVPSTADTVSITTQNSTPIADAGADQSVFVGDVVQLDGSASSDVDGDSLTFAWRIVSAPAGSAAALSDTTSVVPTLPIDRAGTYVVELIVDDGTAPSTADTVQITTLNSPPVANAGDDQTVFVGDTVQLDGAGSTDVDGDALTFLWSLLSTPSGSSAALADAGTALPTFLVDVPGTYVAQLIVDDGVDTSAPDTVMVTTQNSAPVADPGNDQTVFVGSTVQLDGGGSFDADDDPLSFQWSLTSVPPGSNAVLSDTIVVDPTFVVDRAGTYVGQLIVSDGALDSAPASVTISTQNSAPVAVADGPLTVTAGDTIGLDGSSSFDVDGDPLGFQWSLITVPAGSVATLSDPTVVSPTLDADLVGAYIAQLIVDDGVLQSPPDTHTVIAEAANLAPDADAGADQNVTVGDAVDLDGSGSSDPDGDPLTYSWRIVTAPAGSTAMLTGATDVSSQLVPDVPGDYVVELVVNDGELPSAPDQVTIVAAAPVNLPPALQPIGNQTVVPGNTLTLRLTATDPNGDPLAFTASPLPLPAGALLNADTGEFNFAPGLDQIGSVEITFIVSDGDLIDSETITITIDPPATGGVTSLSGRLLDTNDFVNGVETPIVGATITILGSGVTTTSDTNGNFVLSGIPGGPKVLDIDSSTAQNAPNGAPYAGFREGIQLVDGAANPVSRPFFLPRIALDSLTTVDPAVDTVVTNAALGIVMTVKAFSARDANGDLFTGQLSVSEVPEALAPASLPPELQPGLLVTIQPAGVTFNPPAEITFANIDNLAPGTNTETWSLDPSVGRFSVVGIGRVSSDGTVTETVAGGISAAGWHGPLPPQPDPDEDNNDDNQDQDKCEDECTGSRTAISSGNLSVDERLVSYRSLGADRAPRLIYNSMSADPQPIITSNTSIPVRSAVPESMSTRLSVAGVDQGVEVFTATTGLQENVLETIRQAVQFDASNLATGVYPYALTLTNTFPRSRVARITRGEVLVNNGIGSPFGAGWSMEGLDRLDVDQAEALLIGGDGSIARYTGLQLDPVDPPVVETIIEFNDDAFDSREFIAEARDLNDDGVLDFVTTFVAPPVGDPFGEAFSHVEIRFGDTDGNFSLRRAVRTSDFPDECLDGCRFDTVALESADFDNDGVTDIAVVNDITGEIRLLRGLGAGFFDDPVLIPIANLSFGSRIRAADFNADGNIDILLSHGADSVMTLLFGDGAGAFPTSTDLSAILNGGWARSLFVVDVNNDDALDIVWGRHVSQGGRQIYNVAINDGSNGFTPRSGPFSGLAFSEITDPVDVDGDGNVDLVGLTTSNLLRYYWGDGAGNFEINVTNRPNSVTIQTPDLPGSSTSFGLGDVADVDQDGDNDVVIIYNESFSAPRRLLLFLNDGTGELPLRLDITTDIRFFNELAVTDVNLDGLVDIFGRGTQVGTFADKAAVYLINTAEAAAGTGAGSFASPPGDFSRLTRNADGTFTRRAKDGTQWRFGSDGLLASLSDRNSNTTTYSHDPAGRLTSITDPVGLVTTLAYSAGRLSSITDPAGRVTAFEHDAGGDLIRVTHPDGSVRSFTYDSRHRMATQTSKRGFVTTYEYNFAGRNIVANRPDGSTRRVDPSQLVGLVDPATGLGTESNPLAPTRLVDVRSTFTNGRGGVTVFGTDRFGAATAVTDPLGRTTTILRDDDSNPTLLTAPNGRVTRQFFDSNGNLLLRREADGSPLQRDRRFEYEPVFSQVTRMVNPVGDDTRFEYDGNGNVTRIVDALGGERSFTYDARGRVLTRTDENGNVDTVVYDGFGNVQQVTDGAGNVLALTRDLAGNVTQLTQGIGTLEERTDLFTYDVMNRVRTVTDGIGATQSFAYDAAGNLVDEGRATGESVLRVYDALGRVLQIDDPVVGLTQTTYDLDGNVVQMTDARGGATRFAYDLANQRTGITDPLDGERQLAYNVQGNLTSFTDARGGITTYAYDLLERQVMLTDPLGNQESFDYDSRDNLVSSTDRKGQRQDRTYDVLSRLTRIVTPDNTIDLSYDPAGNITAASDSDSGVTFTYDGLHRVVGATTVDVGTQPAVAVTRQFDSHGNRVSLTDSLGGSSLYVFDAADRLTRVTSPGGSAVDLGYDSHGRLTSITRPSLADTTQVYDVDGRLESVQHAVGASVLAGFVYTYDDAGNVTAIDEGAQTRQFTYDALERLVAGGVNGSTESYSYDAAGNRTASHLSSTYSHDLANRLTEDDSFVYAYDLNGNLASRTAKAGGAQTLYTFDAQDQLVRIDFPDGSIARYAYDALGRRIQKDVAGTQTRYVYEGEDIVLEFDAADALLARYVHGDEQDQPLVMERGGEPFFYHADHLGSIRRLTNGAGETVNSYDYDAFGNIETQVVAVANPFTFTARELDEESGLYFYRARYYDPRIGRFLSEDPLHFEAGDANLYQYVFGNPVNYTDPSGQIAPIIAIAVRIAVRVAAAAAARAIARAAARELRRKLREQRRKRERDQERDKNKPSDSGSPQQCSPEDAPQRERKPGTSGGDRAGKDFTPKTKRELDAENAEKYGGTNRCEDCKREVVPGKKSERGVTPPDNERQRDHIIPKSKGGDGSSSNGEILCRRCNLNKSDN